MRWLCSEDPPEGIRVQNEEQFEMLVVKMLSLMVTVPVKGTETVMVVLATVMEAAMMDIVMTATMPTVTMTVIGTGGGTG